MVAFRVDEVTTYKTIVICDKCKRERVLREGTQPLGFDNRMNGALTFGYTFKEVDGHFVNHCPKCK